MSLDEIAGGPGMCNGPLRYYVPLNNALVDVSNVQWLLATFAAQQ